MYLKEIKEMINLMNENDLSELEIEREGFKIRLKKTPQGGYDQVVERVVASSPLAIPAAGEVSEAPQEGIEIKAPMVGTFYRAPSPEASPFVEVGEEIEVDQVVCIIEAMKLMNEIKSEVRGKIKKILVENGGPIEFGQVLFVVEPA